MSACIACAVGAHSLESTIIFENDNIVCFLDHLPINEGHVLICPRAHFCDITDIPPLLISEIFIEAKKIALLLKEKFDCDGVSLLQNNGKFNELGHFHLHVFPRFTGDGFSWVSSSTGIVKRERLAYVRRLLLAC